MRQPHPRIPKRSLTRNDTIFGPHTFEATHIWDLAAVTNFANFAAWLVAGIAILRTGVLPRWVGACCIGGVFGVILAQGAYVALEVLWPLGTGLWFAATVGVVRACSSPRANGQER